jgi:hypothetical protein
MTTSSPTNSHQHFFNHHTGRPRFHFDATSDAAAATAAAATAAAKPWHDGVDSETIGHWDNKGWKKDDPKEIAIAATKQAREAERFFGVPPDQILKLPKADAKPDEIAAFYQRLGAPKESKEYDFSAVKLNGQPLDEALTSALREAMAQAFVPKDRAPAIATAVAKALDDKAAADTTIRTAKLAEEKATLAKNWGVTPDKLETTLNMLQARQGAQRLGITPEAVAALENQIGYAALMDAMRKIGAKTGEDTFVEGGGGSGPTTTRDGAVAKLATLENDKAWGKRLAAGDAAAIAEWSALTAIISGEAA